MSLTVTYCSIVHHAPVGTDGSEGSYIYVWLRYMDIRKQRNVEVGSTEVPVGDVLLANLERMLIDGLLTVFTTLRIDGIGITEYLRDALVGEECSSWE